MSFYTGAQWPEWSSLCSSGVVYRLTITEDFNCWCWLKLIMGGQANLTPGSYGSEQTRKGSSAIIPKQARATEESKRSIKGLE